MNAIDTIRQWCEAKGFPFCYGNPWQVNVWMGETDFLSGTDSTAVYAYLLTDSGYNDGRDTYDVGVFFARLISFDFDHQNIDRVTESLKQMSKGLLNHISNGNTIGWSGARWQYGYNDYAENVAWCCLRVTLTALAADCVPMPEPPTPPAPPTPPTPVYPYNLYCPQIVRGFPDAAGLPNPVFKSSGSPNSIYINFAAPAAYSLVYSYGLYANDRKINSTGSSGRVEITESEIENMKAWMQLQGQQMTEETEEWLRARTGYYICSLQVLVNGLTPPVDMLIGYSATDSECKEAHNL